MGVGRNLNYNNLTRTFNSTYQINLDMSNWDQTCIQVVGPVLGRINLLGSNDGGGGLTTYPVDNAQLAINFSPIQATDLSTGTAVNAIYGPGLFKVPLSAQYLRLQGSPAAAGTNVYRIELFNSKIG